jgi:hypothetical protein
MTYSHLNGQIFKRDGTVYLVMEANDWAAETLNVRTVDSTRAVRQMARDDVLRCVAEAKKRR